MIDAIAYSNGSPLEEEAVGRTHPEHVTGIVAAVERRHEIDEGDAGGARIRSPGISESFDSGEELGGAGGGARSAVLKRKFRSPGGPLFVFWTGGIHGGLPPGTLL